MVSIWSQLSDIDWFCGLQEEIEYVHDGDIDFHASDEDAIEDLQQDGISEESNEDNVEGNGGDTGAGASSGMLVAKRKAGESACYVVFWRHKTYKTLFRAFEILHWARAG